MNTTLDPKPTEAEKRMLWKSAARFATMQDGNTNMKYHPEIAVVKAESLLREFRARYGVTGADVEAICDAEMRAEINRLRNALDTIAELEYPRLDMAWDIAREALKGGPHEAE